MNKKLLFFVLLVATTTTVFCPKGKKPQKGATSQEKQKYRNERNQDKRPVLSDEENPFHRPGKKLSRVNKREAAIALSKAASRGRREREGGKDKKKK